MRHLFLFAILLFASTPAYAKPPAVVRDLTDAAVSETTCLAYHLEDGQGDIICLAIDGAFCRASLVRIGIGGRLNQRNDIPLSWEDPCMARGRLPAVRAALSSPAVPWNALVQLTRHPVAHVGGAIWSAPGSPHVLVEGAEGSITLAQWPSLKVIARWDADDAMPEVQGAWMVPERGIFIVSRIGVSQQPAETLFGWRAFQVRAFEPLVTP